jgi:RNA polymerase sigma-70 factor (ECF subfamily)
LKRTADEVLALLAEHGGHLHALLTRLTLRADVAEDLMQDLFCKLVENQHFAAAASPLAYAIRMATNLAFDHRRAQRRRLPGEAGAEGPTTGDASPLLDLVRREELDQVLDAIGQLPAGGREIVVLRYLEQQDYASIGRQLGKTPHQARALCHKAIARLRVALDAERTKAVARRPAT